MKVTKRQLKKIILEAMPPGGVPDVVGAVTGVYGEEQRQLLDDLGGMYSDMHKELYGRRPRIPMFKTVEEASAAVDEIWEEYGAVNRTREAQEKADLEFIEMKRKMQEMMPGEYDYEHVPKRSGMGRRMENRMRITKRQLRRIIREAYRILTEDASEASMMDFDPVVIGIPALEKALSSQLTDSPEGKGFGGTDASAIADVLEGSEPDIEYFDYDEKRYEEAKAVWDAAEEAGADPGELAASIRQAIKDADDAGYDY